MIMHGMEITLDEGRVISNQATPILSQKYIRIVDRFGNRVKISSDICASIAIELIKHFWFHPDQGKKEDTIKFFNAVIKGLGEEEKALKG